MEEDIRDKSSLTHEDMVALNFIRASVRYYFRRHFKMGLRSHIMEVLRMEDIKRERVGISINGIIHFPMAQPIKIMRLFRTRFANLNEALLEVKRVKLIEKYLGPNFMAKSEEFLVHYALGKNLELLLCGLQVYVKGEPLDPWAPLSFIPFKDILQRLRSIEVGSNQYDLYPVISRAKDQLGEFITRIKKMAIDSGHIPDLAGVGNLLLTASGDPVLVDINNISRVEFTDNIYLDDRGYPVCDKSIQALYLLEKKLTGKDPVKNDPIYRFFINEERLQKVKKIEDKYNKKMLQILA